ncbi:MAG TPA: diacylglycerol kinase family protein [Coriobacteriia bacterium]|nr:diacylglycerol kinase family protein [Coriobacteriia bacterium]
MRVKVIINPAAGKPEPVLSVLNDVFSPAAIDWEVDITHESGDAKRSAQRAADEGYDLVGVYGGDGTVSEVAAGLAEGGPPILLLPGGTGNALAAELGISPGLAEAAALAVGDAGEIRRVDVGRSGDQYFVLRLTTGLEAEMVSAATPEMKDKFGWLAYALSGLSAIAEAPMAAYRFTVDGAEVECEGLAALVANSAMVGVSGLRIAADVDVSDGLLDVVVVQRTDLPGLIGSAADAAQGQQPRMMSRWRGKVIHVETTPVQTVLADGEDAGQTPLDVSVVPGAIGVLVPRLQIGPA